MKVISASVIVLLFCNFGAFVHKIVNKRVLVECEKNKKFLSVFKKKRMLENFVMNAAEPDKRKKKDLGERYKHFFHVNAYEPGEFSRYISREDLKKKILDGKKSGKYKDVGDVDGYIKRHGDLPWVIIDKIVLLKSLMADRGVVESDIDRDDIDNKILSECINLAHYITDFCTPLHLNENYDGCDDYKYGSQTGIHKMWEDVIPRLFFKKYKIAPVKLVIDDLNDYIFSKMVEIYKKSEDILKKDLDIFDIYKSSNKTIYYDLRFKDKKYVKLSAKYYNAYIKKQINLAISLISYIFNKHIFV